MRNYAGEAISRVENLLNAFLTIDKLKTYWSSDLRNHL